MEGHVKRGGKTMNIEQLSLFESKLSPEFIVTQSNQLIETRQNLSLQEKRIILTLISLIQPDEDNFRIHRIKVKDLADILGIDERNFYKKVEAVIQSLQKKSVTIDSPTSTLTMNWLSSSEYFKGKGYVELEFSEKLRPFLLELKKQFTPFKLRNILRLRSDYSIRVYELLKQYQSIKERTFTLEELRYLLHIPKEKYKLYGHLKEKVIKKAQTELVEKTDLSFQFEEKKKGTKVVGVKFFIQKNIQIIQEVIEREHLESDSYSLLIRMGIRPDKAREVLNTFSEERVKENIIYILDNKKKADIDNISGYILAAIEEDYAKVEGDSNYLSLVTKKEHKKQLDIKALKSWAKQEYKGVTGTVARFIIQEKVEGLLKENYYSDEEINKAWHDYQDDIVTTVKDIISLNRTRKGR